MREVADCQKEQFADVHKGSSEFLEAQPQSESRVKMSDVKAYFQGNTKVHLRFMET